MGVSLFAVAGRRDLFASRAQNKYDEIGPNEGWQEQTNRYQSKSLPVAYSSKAVDVGKASPSVKKKAACKYDVGHRGKHSLQFQHSFEATSGMKFISRFGP